MSPQDPRIAKFFARSVAFALPGATPGALFKTARIALGAAAATMALTIVSHEADARPTLTQINAQNGAAAAAIEMDGDFVEIASDLIGLWKRDTVALAMVKNLELESRATGRAALLESDEYKIAYDASTGTGDVVVKKGVFDLDRDTEVIRTDIEVSTTVSSRPVLDAIRAAWSIARGADGQSPDLSDAAQIAKRAARAMDAGFAEIASDVTGIWDGLDAGYEKIVKLEADSVRSGKPETLEAFGYKITYDAATGTGSAYLKKGAFKLNQDVEVARTVDGEEVSVPSLDVLDGVRDALYASRGGDRRFPDLSGVAPAPAANMAPEQRTGLDHLHEGQSDVVDEVPASVLQERYGLREAPESNETDLAEAEAAGPVVDVDKGARSDFRELVAGALYVASNGSADLETAYDRIEASVTSCVLAGLTPCSVTSGQVDLTYQKGALTLSAMERGAKMPIAELRRDGVFAKDEARYANLLRAIGEFPDVRSAAAASKSFSDKILGDNAQRTSPESSSTPEDHADADHWDVPDDAANQISGAVYEGAASNGLLRQAGFSISDAAALGGLVMGPGQQLLGAAKRGVEKLGGKPKPAVKAPARKTPKPRRTSELDGGAVEADVATNEFEDDAPSFRM